ncbi:hypothetical protein C8Q76DRAFT_617655, partial [Earliella scabrosa]
VRKTADARKDRLGPQWSQWVSRTVQRLADDGILDNSDPHGNVMFTPNAKKTITSVRRESLGPGVLPSTNLEHKIWKDVTRRFSTVGIKRSRRRSSAAGGAADDSEEGRPRKRQARRSFSGLTKTELEAELRAALARLEEAEEPQAIDEEEIEALRDELKSRQQEVEELRDEVARLKDNQPTARRVTIGTRLLTPPPTNPSESSTPTTVRRATNLRAPASAHGITRTLSGSLISNLTKRPTPEPSDPGSHDVEIEGMIFDDDATLSPACPEGNDDMFQAYSNDHGLETPQSSPMLANRGELGPSAEEYDGLTDDQRQIVSLKDALEARVSELRHLRDEHHRTLAERDELRASVASRDGRVELLQADVRSRTDALAASELRTAELESKLSSEQQRRHELKIELQASLQAFEEEKSLHASLREKHANLREMELHTLQESFRTVQETMERSEANYRVELQNIKAARDTLQEELTDARRAIEDGNAAKASLSARINALDGALKDARDQASVLTVSNESLEQSVTNLEETVEELRKEASHAKAQAASAFADLKQSQGAIDELRQSHAQAQSDASSSAREAAGLKVTVSELEFALDVLRSQLKEAAAETAGVRAQLATEVASRRRAESELVATREEREGLIADIADKAARLETLVQELERVRQVGDEARRRIASLEAQREKEVAAHVTEKSALESSLETVRAEVAELKTQLDGARSELSTLSDELRIVVAGREELSRRLEDETARVSELQRNMKIALDDVRDAEDEIAELRQAKASDEDSIASLKTALARLRQVQLDALEEVSKVASAQSAPTPGHRRRSSIAPRPGMGRLA